MVGGNGGYLARNKIIGSRCNFNSKFLSTTELMLIYAENML